MLQHCSRLLLLLMVLALSACGSTRTWRYEYRAGRTATVQNGYATAPSKAPRAVRDAIAAGNQIVGSPYQYGGGRREGDTGYDCSGAVSHVLRSAGLLKGTLTSHGFRKYGKGGAGKWITVHATKGHVFLDVAGLRFDTGWTSGPKGPQWTTKSRPMKYYVDRHPPGL